MFGFKEGGPALNPETNKQLGSGESLERVVPAPKKFVPPEETGVTQYDQLLKDFDDENTVSSSEDGKFDEVAEEIAAQFVQLDEQTEKQRESERMGAGNWDEHARGGNSKPKDKDYRLAA